DQGYWGKLLDLDRISSKGGAYACGGRASDLGRVMDGWRRSCGVFLDPNNPATYDNVDFVVKYSLELQAW
ncbi:MAG TPA: hypothetical protein DEQ81_05315, partial [Alphaproteobacteria bacterium]|nr:hypothetical protein [Alphaproteobacteria bacterium]